MIADCLDKVGVRDNVMDPRIRPVYQSARVVGFASTVKAIEVEGPPADKDDYYKGELQAVDALTDGDIMVVSQARGSYWGSCWRPPRATAAAGGSWPTPGRATRFS